MEKFQVLVRAPAFHRLATTIARSDYATDDFKKNPIIATMMTQQASRQFPVQDPHPLSTAMSEMIRAYDAPELFSHVHFLSTIGRVATAFISEHNATSSRDERIVEIQDLNAVCRDWHSRWCDDSVVTATFVPSDPMDLRSSSSSSRQYVLFQMI